MVGSARPCILLSSNGEFFERDLSSVRLDHPGLAEIDQHEIGGRALLEAARCQAQQLRRIDGHALASSGIRPISPLW